MWPRALFWFSAALLPLNLYFIAFGTLSPVMSASAAAVNVFTMVQMKELM